MCPWEASRPPGSRGSEVRRVDRPAAQCRSEAQGSCPRRGRASVLKAQLGVGGDLEGTPDAQGTGSLSLTLGEERPCSVPHVSSVKQV